ncbi:MAG TPA: hypothetical protein VGP93_06860 [Polyangiaceae bacterium]|nr:hypothetical protein [Polyangiaceae bacterium]
MSAFRYWLAAALLLVPLLAHAQMPAGAARPNPHAAGAQLPADRSAPAPDLPAGTIEATIQDQHGAPQVAVDVRLGILFQTVAEGESRESRTARSDGEGRVTFSGLKVGSGHSYRITVQHGPADYGSAPFNLSEAAGQRVLLHVYPATSDIDKTMVGMRGFVYIEPRDDVFQFEVLFRVFNVGDITWLPKNATMALPKGFKAFRANDSMDDTRFEASEGFGAKLLGTYAPGQRDVVFRFQVPKQNRDIASFQLGLPPHVAEIRVIAEANTSMRLEVDGFEPTQSDVAQSGERVLVTRKLLDRPDEKLQGFTIVLSGIPVPSSGRWLAVVIALGLACLGGLAARGFFDGSLATAGVGDDDRKKARELILKHLIDVERARRDGKLGPSAYDQLHRKLLDAVARLGVAVPDRSRRPKRRLQKRASEASTG